MTKKSDELIEEYGPRLRDLGPLARRAFGARTSTSPAHDASREYTRLLVEFHERGGNLAQLARELGVAYSGLRRRVFTADVPSVRRTKSALTEKVTTDMIDEAVDRVSRAKSASSTLYHEQLYLEFERGIPMNVLAKRLGISNAAPLYYGVQAHSKRIAERTGS